MGAQWKHAGRIENASKRGALTSKLVKEIMVAARTGDSQPENNYRLRAAVEMARKMSVPRDTIERAIKKGSGALGEDVHYETLNYEGFAPHQVPVIVECLTDNRNRTVADVRLLFRKGIIGAVGSISWMFEREGLIEAHHPNPGDLEAVAIECGAQNVEVLPDAALGQRESAARFACDPQDLDAVHRQLLESGWTITHAELGYTAKNPLDLAADQRAEVVDFLQALDDHGDVHRVYAALRG